MRFNFVLVSCFLLVPTVLSDSWAGGIVQGDDGAFNYVKGIFTAPQLWGDPGSALAQWVSFDEKQCQASLTSGIVSVVTSTGIQHQGFLSWTPSAPLDFDIAISTGDNIQVELSLSDQSTGSLVFKNLNSDKNVTQTFQSSFSVCGSEAGWMVGFAKTPERWLDLSPFDHLTIKGATAGARNGSSYQPFEQQVCNVVANPGGVKTGTTAHPDDSLTVAYTG